MGDGKRKIPELFQIKTISLLRKNRPTSKNYKTVSFSKKGLELKFQPMPDCHHKKIQKHSGYQENQIFTKTINSYIPYKGVAERTLYFY